MIFVPKSKQFEYDGETYAKDLYFPKVGTFIKLNTVLAKNTVVTLKKLAKGLEVPRYSMLRKGELIGEIKIRLIFD